MKRCPVCRRIYDHRAVICQVDGTALGHAAANVDPLVGQTITRRYRVIRKLGGSALGAVYLAQEVATGSEVAVKVLLSETRRDVDLVKQFFWEARLAAASDPSRIVRVYEVDRSDEGRVVIAMEYLEGASLADLIRREGALAPGRALRLTIQIAQGLAAASQAGVTHRNLKPQNVVLVRPDEQVKLTDFGIGRLRETALGVRPAGPGLTAAEYLAPEQLAGGDVSYRADIYALGAVLYTMLTGSAPAAPEPTPPRALRPEVPEALEQFVVRAMERRPDRRHGGMEEVIECLRALAVPVSPPAPVMEASGPTAAGVVNRLGAAWREARRRTLVLTGVAALVVAGLATWAVSEWSSVGGASRAAEESPRSRERENERRREEARASTADLLRQMPGAARRPDEKRPHQAEARAALLRVEPSPSRSVEELFRLRTQAQQKLHSRGLFRVSAADRWGVTLEIGARGEVILSGLLPDRAAYEEALQLVREIPGVADVQAANLRVAAGG